jgi:hypothetical protein
MDNGLLRLIGAALVIIGGIAKLIFKTRRPPIGQIIMSCIWIGVTLLVAGYIMKTLGE